VKKNPIFNEGEKEKNARTREGTGSKKIKKIAIGLPKGRPWGRLNLRVKPLDMKSNSQEKTR